MHYMFITIFSWVLYMIALVLKSYANHIRFMSFDEMPMTFSRSPGFASKFWLTRLVVTYGSFAGLWFVHGVYVLIGAFLFYRLVCFFTFGRGYRSSVNRWARLDLERQRLEAIKNGENFDKIGAWLKAVKSASGWIKENATRNGSL